jgi:hypothetical protein
VRPFSAIGYRFVDLGPDPMSQGFIAPNPFIGPRSAIEKGRRIDFFRSKDNSTRIYHFGDCPLALNIALIGPRHLSKNFE